MKVKVCEENSALIGGALECVQYGCSTRIDGPGMGDMIRVRTSTPEDMHEGHICRC